MSKIFACGVGIGTQNKKAEWLEVYYPYPLLNPDEKVTQLFLEIIGDTTENTVISPSKDVLEKFAEDLDNCGYHDLSLAIEKMRTGKRPIIMTVLFEDTSPKNVPESYLKLHLLSHTLVKPHSINLNGIFGILPNVAWTNMGAMDLNEVHEEQLNARVEGKLLHILSVDKFPPMVDYIIPQGVRIATGSRVRLGAYLGKGTTVMHAGFINFNAGCMGPNMIEGRVSAGVTIGANTDLGGGSSTMGTLSGGGDIVISLGENCLVGANAGTGIPLGNDCTIEAGLYVTASAVVNVLDDEGKKVATVKARELAGKDGLLFRRNSQSGEIEVLPLKACIVLNQELHKHN